MAFGNIDGQVLTDSEGITYVISDRFSVFYPGENAPVVYSWNEVTSVRTGGSSITIITADAEYTMRSDAFESREQFICAKALAISCASKSGAYASSSVSILPDKKLYEVCDIPMTACVESGEYNIKDIKSAMLLVVVSKITRILWAAGILGGVVGLVLLHVLIGFSESNWWYLMIGGFFFGVGTVCVTYLVFVFITRMSYSGVLSSYTRHPDQVTFAICDMGFSACESCAFSSYGLIRWNIKDTFVETSAMFVILRAGRAIAWIPKAFFTKEQQDEIGNILMLNLAEK